jgi:hypothetical protein
MGYGTRIAGHYFEQTPTGRRCTTFTSDMICPCMCRWIDIRKADHKSLEDAKGWAHSGRLNMPEYLEIQKEVDREEKEIWDAVIDFSAIGTAR